MAATAVSAVAGVASANGSVGGWLFDPSAVGPEDATGFAEIDVAAMREHDDLLELDESDVRNAWTSDGADSVDAMIDDVADRVDFRLRDAKTAIDQSGVAAEDVDRVAAIGSSRVGGDGSIGGVVVEGSVSGPDVVEGLNQVTEMDSVSSADEYDRYSVSDADLEGDVVVAASEGRVIAGGTGDVDASGADIINQLIDAHDGNVARFGPESSYSGDIFAELDTAGVAGVEWKYSGESSNLVPDHAESAVEAKGFVPDDVDAGTFTEGVGAVAVGVDPSGPRAAGVVAYDGDAPVAAAQDTLSMLQDDYPEKFDDVDVSVEGSGNLLVVEASTTADALKDAQADLKVRSESAGTLRRGVTVSALPTLKGAAWTVKNYWNSFVDNYI
ncbi:hypothetical protein BRD00_06450 [Halobacteriales archaeon QS_8_69_26]|nr:MAG: hypothetical protein BRD00_06450 [Halobacteriales archaeon QS_8_69_26]